VSGSDHCQPMVNCDQMAMPNARKTPNAQPSDAKLARTWSPGSIAWPVSPALVSLAVSPLQATSALRRNERGRSQISAVSSSVNSSP
jgi:hypothetical protein